MSHHRPSRISFGPFLLDPGTHELWKHGVKIRLARQPIEILKILLNNPGQLITREQLRDLLWPADTFVDFDHSLNAAINKLREALSDSADEPRYIETLPRRGYRFIAPVTPGEPSASSAGILPASFLSGTSSEVLEGGLSRSTHLENVSFRGPHSPEESASAFSDDVMATGTRASTPTLAAAKKRASAPEELLSPATHHSPPATAPSLSKSPYLLAAVILALLIPTMLFLKRVNSSTTHPTPASLPHIKPLTNLSGPTAEPSFSPSGDFIAFRREGPTPEASGIFVQSLATGAVTQLTHTENDCCPAFSPDGHSIAFARFGNNNEISFFTIPFSPSQPAANPAAEQKLNLPASPRRPEIAFSPDGKSLAFSAASGIVLFSLEDSTTRPLTEAPPSAQDWGPSFSRDGREILFVRSIESGFSDELLTVPIRGGEITQIASEHARILGPPQWSADGQSVIFASGRGSHPGLWRVSAHLRDTPVQINDSGWYPSISRATSRLAYQRITRALNIWEINLAAPSPQPRILIPSTSETDQGPGPQISPDGAKLAYMSDRSGTMEIWVSDRDGSNARQLTLMGGVGTPRWSPDSRSIAFDVQRRDGSGIYVITLDSTPPRLLTPDQHYNVCPSWSRDSKWVYFASTRSGEFQVWKIPSAGGNPTQVTLHGGHAALPSADGKLIYYAKNSYANPEIWQVPANGGGAEKLVSPLLRPASWASWAVTNRGIVFASSSGKGKPIASLFDTATQRVTPLATLNIVPFWLSASSDGQSLFFDQPGWQQAQIMLVDNFH